jgi:flagellar M-ring protein FliF
VPNLDQTFTRLNGLFGALSTRQLVSLVGVFIAVVTMVAGTGYWVTRPTYTLLFADMDPAAASEVIAKLDAQKITYELAPGGGGIRVPSTQVDRLRLDFAAQGLPSSGRIGFEIFDRTAFGQTEFLEHVNYRRALEGEIARTIAVLKEVSGARVHIAMAKESLFGAREQPAKASVVLTLRNPSRALAAATVTGITNLIAASVEGLRPEAVVVMDSFGRPLARPSAEDDSAPLGAAQTERQRNAEHQMSEQLVSLLEPVVGSDRVRVNVALRLSASSEEQTEEKWDPATAVVRSRQMSNDIGPGSTTGAIAGARANLPPPAGPAGVPPPTPAPTMQTASTGRSNETTNYEISRTTRHVVKPSGEVARLSVAVVLDDEMVTKKDAKGQISRTSRPRKPEELQKIQGIVSAAVGLDTARGDQLTVENIAFDSPATEEPVPPTFIEQYGSTAGEGARIIGVLLLIALVLAFVVRPVVQAAVAGGGPRVALATAGVSGQLPRTVQDMEGEIEAQLTAAADHKRLETIKMPVLTKKANAIVQSEPEAAARLLRSWLGEDERK